MGVEELRIIFLVLRFQSLEVWRRWFVSNYCDFHFFFFESYAFDWLRYKDSMQLNAMANENPIPPHPRKHANSQVPLV